MARPVAIVGGGLAGLAAAVALASAGVEVVLFEARRKLGGRAASFRDPLTGELIDHCQHVGMGCCTNLADFCRRVGAADLLRRDRTHHFLDEQGRRADLRGVCWLPAPFHLAPGLWKLRFLSWRARLSIGRTLWRLARLSPARTAPETIGSWLRRQGQSDETLERFWSVVLVSALGESLDRASLRAARKVFVDGFLAARSAYELDVPRVALSEFYGDRMERFLKASRVDMRLETAVKMIAPVPHGVSIAADSAEAQTFAQAIVAVPWRRLPEILNAELRAAWPAVEEFGRFPASPISAVHFWFDRPITDLPHAVLVGGLSQWVFRRPAVQRPDGDTSTREHYFQVVISASRSLTGRTLADIIDEVDAELRRVFPAAREARLVRSRLVTEHEAVFSLTPEVERLRPSQRTPWPNLFLAGDWTATGWPATMEGAVRSGYLAAEAVLRDRGQPSTLVAPDLPRSWLSRLLFPE